MTAQIIEFPVHRVRQATEVQPVIRSRVSAAIEMRTSVKIARAVLFWILVSSVIYSLFFSAGANVGSAQASGENSTSSQVGTFDYVTVMSGDTLWSLAETYAPDRDPRDFIIDLVALNNLGDSLISPGMRLALPKY